MASLLLALSIYTAAFIAEIVRAGIQAVSHGQTEASFSLGLNSGVTLRLIILPQALRVIIPPMTNQYLNLTKNSSLAAAIGYPDLVSSFAGTVLNQTGQAIECIAITMAVYLTISLLISLADELVQPAGRPGGALTHGRIPPSPSRPAAARQHHRPMAAGCAAICSPRRSISLLTLLAAYLLWVAVPPLLQLDAVQRHLERRYPCRLSGQQWRLLGVHPGSFRAVHVRLLPGSPALAGQSAPCCC